MSASAAGATAARARHEDLVTDTYRRLRELIVRGKLAAGARIVESDVAVRLGVSRTPVRSALQRLQHEGYVVSSSTGKQIRLSVAPLTREDARELLGILAEIEGLGARWAAELPASRRALLVAELEELNASLAAAAQRLPADPNEVFDLHTRFHGQCLAGLHAPRLLALHRAIKPQAERYRRIYSNAFAQDSRVSVDEHAVIIRRIQEGDADGAQRAVQMNWRNAADRLAEIITVLGERGSW